MPSPHRTAIADAPRDPTQVVRSTADALCRAAMECCRQHDRSARLPADDGGELEHRQADELCRLCDGSLVELSDAYTAAAASLHPAGDQAWWHKANALWHASREYARRHAGCDALGKRLSAKHDSGRLGEMQMEYELEASALLALRHAAEAYRATRPDLA